MISDEEEDYEEMLQKGLLEKNENDVRNRSRANYNSDSGEFQIRISRFNGFCFLLLYLFFQFKIIC
jgi:hypothetical protein